ncbi:hypothetical protein FA13DRAFT_1819592 [Coprinellus micaceus]|uniref:Extracellular membrane protein CFEM domain-containing protein n=1 Tax=Coprinellus micaceus TaxID=71717 RepID=A0A4Y7SI24_COPMI|nr:hypothetical protein FA13DRAFT_1819592 [Coprinellus micaceus]
MHFSYAVVAALVAGQAYASTVNVLPRQTPEDLMKMIPPACSSACQPITSLQTECSSAPEPTACACTAGNLKAMQDCTTCIVEELTKDSGVSASTIQPSIDAAQQAFKDMCNAGGHPIGGSTSTGSSGGSSSGTTTAAASGSTGTAGSTLGSGNSGVRVEFAGSALLAVAGLVGAFFL